MTIAFRFQKKIRLPARKSLKAFIGKLFEKENKKAGDITIIFCTDKFLLDLNSKFLLHDYYTDILTFDLSPAISELITAEIYISIDRVKENAKIYEELVNMELHRVILHGILHLSGYKDKTPFQKRQIRAKEEKYLKLYFK